MRVRGAWTVCAVALLLAGGCAADPVGRAAQPVGAAPGKRLSAVLPAAPLSSPTTGVVPLHSLPTGTRQAIVVESDGYAATRAVLETFTRAGTGWLPALGPMAARIGSAGFSDHKVEGDQTTPTGVYGIAPTMYGIAADPGVRYRYHRLVPGDYWDENPRSAGYNRFVHGADPGGGSEPLWRVSPQYTYLAVIAYNDPPRPSRGSAIFLHVVHPGHATAGCVSLAGPDLARVLRWLDPAAAPRIVLAPRQVIDRY